MVVSRQNTPLANELAKYLLRRDVRRNSEFTTGSEATSPGERRWGGRKDTEKRWKGSQREV